MEIPQVSILSTIKAIISSKKRVDEVTLYKLIKRELQSITNEDITDTLKTLCEMRLTENKPSNDKSSFFLTDNSYIADSQPHIPTKMATPITEKAHLLKFNHLLLKMKLTLLLPAMLRITIMIPQRH